ncbi:MAG: histidinol dehydrogenase [Sediminibacterium sp.]|nr:histidinol dehydrogenase [Sediminibacterium sp.]
MNSNRYIEPTRDQFKELSARPRLNQQDLDFFITDVFNQVQQNGDGALMKFSEQFDGVCLTQLVVSVEEFDEAVSELQTELKQAIETAYSNIYTFHEAQKEQPISVQTMPGVQCWRKPVPIERVGLYIPGGTAPLFSTVLMLGIPALIAGCREVVMCTPPQKNGRVHPAILYAAKRCGISMVVKAGGASAIAAMVFGTESVPAVNKLFGPGNQYVTAAKQKALQFGLAIDMPAGPSEVLVYADETANPAFVAADLLSQAEHGADSQVILLTNRQEIAKRVEVELDRQLMALPRAQMAGAALSNSKVIVLSDEQDAIHFINTYSPEHLILACKNEEIFVQGIFNAGSVFIGNYTPESAGDYASGTNHTLPTNGYAKNYSGVSLDSFVKKITYQKISPDGLKLLGKAIMVMAEAEQLQAHKQAVEIRLRAIESGELETIPKTK